MMHKPRLVFAGTPEFAVSCLDAVVREGHLVRAVFTQPDRPAGRGRRIQQSPVKRFALEHGIEVLQPQSFRRDASAVDVLRGLAADLMIVVAYGVILPIPVLEAPRLGCVNVHASLLPRWRGAAPIQRAILAGDTRTGVCIMGMEAGLDTGPVYHRRECPIEPRETGGSLHDRIADLGAQALVDALPGIVDGSLDAVPQDDAGTTYASKLTKEEAEIDWSLTAQEIDRQVRAFDPWPVARTCLGADSLRIWAAEPTGEAPSDARPGTVFRADRSGLLVATGTGALAISRLQLAGKRPMNALDLINSRRLDGVRLG